ncbi:MAG: copper amine oxidase N-terminal domain-containing protein [Candidatus Eremiobacteraeota bacterium]|nr:copper amine oxidase N-terminal domain-containing protein [Candidatus Eremiobacteraeota bacterium]
MMTRTTAFAALFAVLTPTALPLAAGAQSAPVSVSVNGAAIAFDQPPVERAGRVYVPLRGVFERLGASVVYQNGKIAATRGNTTVALQIGANVAIVNGAQTMLDSPPFIVGARTLVPLRFVAQALGASVNYDGRTRAVLITQPVAGAAPPGGPPVVITPVPQGAPLRLVRVEPSPNATVRSLRPQIGGTFPREVDANAVRVQLDGRDITQYAYVSSHAFSYDPTYDLPYGRHRVAVTAPGIAESWTFLNAAQPNENFFRDVSPPNGTAVPRTFTVQGWTKPNSRVHIVATSSAFISFGETNESTITTDSGADPNGHFARQITVPDAGAGVIDVRLEAFAPDGGTAVRTLRLRPQP